jgi:hypothetical protein
MAKNPHLDIKLIKLPAEGIVTRDAVPIKRGLTIYFYYAPTLSPYVVIGDHAIRYGYETKIVVIREPSHVIAGMNPLDFVADSQLWRDFHYKHYRREY